MKAYQYKLQWLMPLNGHIGTSTKEARKKVYDFINSIGAKSLTAVYFRDRDLKTIDSYSNMVSYSTEEGANSALINLVASIDPEGDAQYIEFLRK